MVDVEVESIHTRIIRRTAEIRSIETRIAAIEKEVGYDSDGRLLPLEQQTPEYKKLLRRWDDVFDRKYVEILEHCGLQEMALLYRDNRQEEVCDRAEWLPSIESSKGRLRTPALINILKLMRNHIHPGRRVLDRPWCETEKRDYEDAHAIYVALLGALGSKFARLPESQASD